MDEVPESKVPLNIQHATYIKQIISRLNEYFETTLGRRVTTERWCFCDGISQLCGSVGRRDKERRAVGGAT